MEPAESFFLNIKVKTIDNQIFDFEVKPAETILNLKNQILAKLQVPIDRQRLIFRGKLLNNTDTFLQLKVEAGFVLHLIASLA
jgi:Ubiquitin family